MRLYTKNDYNSLKPKLRKYRKKTLTEIVRISESFQVQTREGMLTCKDGYLAFDSDGWPYPIAFEEHGNIYKLEEK